MMNLGTFFAQEVAAGWRPRRPASPAELPHLTVSSGRGTCVAPLLCEGDIVYCDPHAEPSDGALVACQLSERGVAAQNSGLPPGQSPWTVGAGWIKLYGKYCGIP